MTIFNARYTPNGINIYNYDYDYDHLFNGIYVTCSMYDEFKSLEEKESR